jgi:hypothetical protein
VDVLSEKPDFSAWDAWMQAYIDQGLTCFWVPFGGYTDSRERLAGAARVWGRHLREKGGEAAAFASEANALIDWGAKEDQAWLTELRSRPEAVLEVRRAVAGAIERADRLLAQ